MENLIIELEKFLREEIDKNTNLKCRCAEEKNYNYYEGKEQMAKQILSFIKK